MKMHPLETGIPIPPKIFDCKYKFQEFVKVGQTRFYETEDIAESRRLQSAASHFANDKGIKFVTRIKQNGIRVWRTA